MNLLTLGKLNSITDKMGYDDLFHLYMVITTSKGVKLVLEKNHVINMTTTMKKEENIRGHLN